MILMVGGDGRGCGKTAVIEGILRGLPEAEWAAIKVSPHDHTVSASATGGAQKESKDSARFIAAGAVESYLVSDPDPELRAWQLRKVCLPGRNVVVESTSMVEFVQPDCFLLVRRAEADDFLKLSAKRWSHLADALVFVGDAGTAKSSRPAYPVPIYRVSPPGFENLELIEFLRGKL